MGIPATAWEDPQDLKKQNDSDDELGGGENNDGGMTPRQRNALQLLKQVRKLSR